MTVDDLTRLQVALTGRYTVEVELGRGGMATVYLASDLKHHRRVAIKVLRPEIAAALGPERFLREIATAARLNHPHILSLHDSGEANGLLYYYVMPYVEGETGGYAAGVLWLSACISGLEVARRWQVVALPGRRRAV